MNRVTAAFLRISGVGEKKLEDFGARFLEVIQSFLQSNTRQLFAAPAPLAKARQLNSTSYESLNLLRSGMGVKEIAATRGLAVSTIYGHLCNAIEAGEAVPMNRLITPDQQQAIENVLAEFGDNIWGAIERLGDTYDVGLLKVHQTIKRQSV